MDLNALNNVPTASPGPVSVPADAASPSQRAEALADLLNAANHADLNTEDSAAFTAVQSARQAASEVLFLDVDSQETPASPSLPKVPNPIPDIENHAKLTQHGRLLKHEALSSRLTEMHAQAQKGIERLGQFPQSEQRDAAIASLEQLQQNLSSPDTNAVKGLQNFLIRNDNIRESRRADGGPHRESFDSSLRYTSQGGENRAADGLYGFRTDEAIRTFIQRAANEGLSKTHKGEMPLHPPEIPRSPGGGSLPEGIDVPVTTASPVTTAPPVSSEAISDEPQDQIAYVAAMHEIDAELIKAGAVNILNISGLEPGIFSTQLKVHARDNGQGNEVTLSSAEKALVDSGATETKSAKALFKSYQRVLSHFANSENPAQARQIERLMGQRLELMQNGEAKGFEYQFLLQDWLSNAHLRGVDDISQYLNN